MRRLVKARSETIVYLLFNLKSITVMRESIKYSVALRPNPMNAEEEPKAYASMQHQKTIMLEELADHIVEHGSPFSKGAIYGIIVDLTQCASEALQEGNNVDLGDLGKITTAITSEGASSGVDEDGNPVTALQNFTSANIIGINVNFKPGAKLQRKLREATFEPTISRKAQAAALRAEKEGKKNADWNDPEEGNEGGGNQEP